MRAAFIASIPPRVMKEVESKEGSSHFDEKALNLIGHYGNIFYDKSTLDLSIEFV